MNYNNLLDKAMQTGLFDYIWVQFYNNDQCQYSDAKGIQPLIDSWNQWITKYKADKFYLGLPASTAAAPSGGFVPIDKLNNDIIPKLKTSTKFGGIELWYRFHDKTSDYSSKIKCTTPHVAFNVLGESLLVDDMMKSASEVLESQF